MPENDPRDYSLVLPPEAVEVLGLQEEIELLEIENVKLRAALRQIADIAKRNDP
jgi:hypothetical protein